MEQQIIGKVVVKVADRRGHLLVCRMIEGEGRYLFSKEWWKIMSVLFPGLRKDKSSEIELVVSCVLRASSS